MKLRHLFNYFILFSFTQAIFLSCTNAQETSDIILGIEQPTTYLPILQNKKVGIVSNQTSLINDKHLVDFLLENKVNIQTIFSLEHGFRGNKDAGEKINNSIDEKTNLPIISLYGKHKKPTSLDVDGLDIIVFDIQDVGVRFYTYISSLHYIMEACAENNVQIIILDKPNPNAFYIDGPVLDTNFRSFIGMHPVPVVYGMTIGEYAKMIKGENWINEASILDLKIIKCLNYSHNDIYHLKTPPSPNLPNWESVYLYPSLCFFEGTDISIGRGTDLPFQIFGTPIDSTFGNFSFKPLSNYGSKNPKHKNEICFGYNIKHEAEQLELRKMKMLNLNWLITSYKIYESKNKTFFTRPDFFDLLAGTDSLRAQIKKNKSIEEIKKSWCKEIENFKTIRNKYLLYK